MYNHFCPSGQRTGEKVTENVSVDLKVDLTADSMSLKAWSDGVGCVEEDVRMTGGYFGILMDDMGDVE